MRFVSPADRAGSERVEDADAGGFAQGAATTTIPQLFDVEVKKLTSAFVLVDFLSDLSFSDRSRFS